MSQWAEPRSESEGGFRGIMRMSKWMVFCGLVLAVTCQPAVCSIFSGPNIGLGANPSGSAFSHNWVTSNLTLVDTADGMKITGSMSATINEPTDVGFISGGYTLNTGRPLGDVTGVDLVLIAQQSGTLSFTGPINVTSINTITSVGSCASALAGMDTGGNPLVSLSPGSIAAGPAEGPCQTNGGFLNLSWSFVYNLPAGGSGTITIDFGNSIIGEAVDSAVPEPSTLWLLSAIIPVVLIRRRA